MRYVGDVRVKFCIWPHAEQFYIYFLKLLLLLRNLINCYRNLCFKNFKSI